MYFLGIGLGGSLGAVLRYSVSQYISTKYGENSYPLATKIINLTGSFLLGLYMGFQHLLLLNPTVEAMFILGFLSSYTTFSTFIYEAFNLIQQKKSSTAILYLTTSMGLGMLFVFAGLSIGLFF